MGSNSIDDYWVDGGGSDGDLRYAIESFCDMDPDAGVAIDEADADICVVEQTTSRKRNDSWMGSKSKACREKMRRDKLNDRFLELSLILEPSRPPKSDKASILSDASRVLQQLKAESQELRESNEKLQETIKDLKKKIDGYDYQMEKNELRGEKTKLKADKERLEQQIKAMNMPPAGFVPHPLAFHSAAAPSAFAPHFQAPLNNAAAHFPTYPGMAMCQWFPPAAVDTTQDTNLWPPNA